MPNYVQGSLFEDDYLIRTLGALAHSADVALTELVANAWDAGASQVEIFIPDKQEESMIIEDDGVGLTFEQFHNRWMKLGYDRIKHQGTQVNFPKGRSGKRLAYGRNGVGRHGLLCFNNKYVVITKAEGKKSTFTISTLSENEPFVLESESIVDETGHSTRLEVIVTKNLPNPDRILQVLSARFLHDPQFTVKINGKSVPLEKHSGLMDTTKRQVDGISLEMHFIDSQKAAPSTLYQGIAFWQAGRLVGEPSWLLGTKSLIDGRTRFAKQYTVVVKTNDLAEYIVEDWTGFNKCDQMDKIYDCVSEYVNDMFSKIAKDHLDDTKIQIKREFEKSINTLSPLGKYEVDEAIEAIAVEHPMASPDAISLAIETVINLGQTRNGRELIRKISQLSEEDISGLNRILDQWSIKDALCVLDEIDNRISVIEAIKKLSSDKTVDELKTLHPLITEARWLFGPEYDSPEYASNKQLKTVVKELLKVELGAETFENHRKRPDLVIINDTSMSFTGTESFNKDSNLVTIDKILIVELKKGGFRLTRKERDQAVGYVEDFIKCGSIIGSPYIDAFVVGEQVDNKLDSVLTLSRGKVHITTFAQLVDTAERRLFRLRERLSERYDNVPGIELYKKAIQQDLNIQ